MYSIDDFAKLPLGTSFDQTIPLRDIQIGQSNANLEKAFFHYRRDWSSRVICHAESQANKLGMIENPISLGSAFPGENFHCLSQRYNDLSIVELGFTSLREPFVFGETFPAHRATAIVINGPSTYFQSRGLAWETESASFEYSTFPEINGKIGDKEVVAGLGIPTGTLTVQKVGLPVSKDDIWTELYRANRALSFASGIGVGVGHVSVSEVEKRYWMLGFSSFDRLPRQNNWFDLEMVSDFPLFATAFSGFLESEPPAMPLTYSADFYRASNASRLSSLPLAVIASYS